MKPKKKTRSQLVKELDKVFSEYIRKRDIMLCGNSKCFTCGKVDDWRNLQCGHFQSRKHYATRWDEQNCQVQCAGCNIFRSGEQFKFGVNLDKKYGQGTAETLERMARFTIKFSNVELAEKIEYYKQLIKEI